MSFEATCERSPTTLKTFMDMVVAVVVELMKVERVEDVEAARVLRLTLAQGACICCL
jgi:hypothetical protein